MSGIRCEIIGKASNLVCIVWNNIWINALKGELWEKIPSKGLPQSWTNEFNDCRRIKQHIKNISQPFYNTRGGNNGRLLGIIHICECIYLENRQIQRTFANEAFVSISTKLIRGLQLRKKWVASCVFAID